MSLIYADYLYKDVIVTSMRGGVYKGYISDFGDAFDGEEEYDRAEEYLVVSSGGGSYMLLFESEIKEIVVLPEEDEDEDEEEDEDEDEEEEV